MTKTVQLFTLFIILFGFTSCYNYKQLRLLQENNPSLPVYEKETYTDYRIKVNDEIIYRLLTSDEISAKMLSNDNGNANPMYQTAYRVYPDSTIDLPFLRRIPVAGLTLNEAALVIENKFKEMIPDAVVKLSLQNKSFTVFGDAGSGVFPIYKEKLTIFQALSMSGDFNESSDRKHVRIIREGEKGTQVLEFDIRPKSVIDSKYYYIYPNDIIYVRQEFSSFYKVNNYSTLINVVTFSMNLLFTVLNYSK